MGIRFEQEENPVLEEKVPLQILEAAASGKNTEYRLTIGWKKKTVEDRYIRRFFAVHPRRADYEKMWLPPEEAVQPDIWRRRFHNVEELAARSESDRLYWQGAIAIDCMAESFLESEAAANWRLCEAFASLAEAMLLEHWNELPAQRKPLCKRWIALLEQDYAVWGWTKERFDSLYFALTVYLIACIEEGAYDDALELWKTQSDQLAQLQNQSAELWITEARAQVDRVVERLENVAAAKARKRKRTRKGSK